MSEAMANSRQACAACAEELELGSGWVSRDSTPLILDLQYKFAILPFNSDLRCAASGMPLDVCETFLNDPKQVYLYLFRQPLHAALADQFDVHTAALPKSFQIPAECHEQPPNIQHWRMQDVQKCTDVLKTLLAHSLTPH